jgi:hypothetical protein
MVPTIEGGGVLEEKLEALRKEYNAAVANGLLIKAKQIGRQMDRLAHANGIPLADCLCTPCRSGTFGKTHV